MRVLVTGAKGMLGTDICSALIAAGQEPIATDVVDGAQFLDITDFECVRRAISEGRPDTVIHCAAYTNVDKAETEPDAAYRLNALGSWTIGAACAERGIPVCAISTDFVFDGNKLEPYTEFDSPNPLSHYGASKLAGENCIRQICRKFWIVRTAWLFGLYGKSFPNSILTAAETRPELRVVADQKGSPTYTADLAEALVELIKSPLYGTYHLTNSGATTWHGFASKAIELAGFSHASVVPISSDEWPTPVKRPANSVLRPLALEMQNRYHMRPWDEALSEFVKKRAEMKSA
jgi:dTDP-4-dehydrorhamnose reductase